MLAYIYFLCGFFFCCCCQISISKKYFKIESWPKKLTSCQPRLSHPKLKIDTQFQNNENPPITRHCNDFVGPQLNDAASFIPVIPARHLLPSHQPSAQSELIKASHLIKHIQMAIFIRRSIWWQRGEYPDWLTGEVCRTTMWHCLISKVWVTKTYCSILFSGIWRRRAGWFLQQTAGGLLREMRFCLWCL